MKSYVIIGNGTAAVGCIEGIRSVDTKGKITVVSKEDCPSYCRPLISYCLEGKTDTERMNYRADDFYTANNCTVMYDCYAQKINHADKTVTLNNDTVIDYDTLCIATGSSPFVPPMEGIDLVEKKFSFMTKADMLGIDKAVNKDSRVLIIGAGLIGLKCAEGLKDRVKSITVCDLADRVLSSILDNDSAEIVEKNLEANGIKILLGNSVSKFKSNKAYMKNGEEVYFDILVTAVGVRANISLISEIGGACGRGITIDERMSTSIKDIYAAGDCTESVDVSDNTVKVMALMPNAYIQGNCAGVNMAGGESSVENTIPMNSIGFFGEHIMTAGSRTSQSDGGVVYEEKHDNGYKKLYVKDNKLIGFMLIGYVDKAGIYTNMIRNGISLNTVDFESVKNNPNLFAFDTEYRGKMLGGVI